jgi:tetratricopeptide (TPR) repeat protein
MSEKSADALMQKANTQYAEGAYTAALVLYDSVHRHYSGASLLFNMGNCHFKLGRVPQAILWYERALRLAPGNEDIKTNLELAQQRVVDRVTALPGFALGSGWQRFRSGKNTDQWALLALWACSFCFVFFALYALLPVNALRRSALGLGVLVAFFTLVAIAFAAYRHRELRDDRMAIVLEPKVDVRSEPKQGARVLFVIHEGTKVEVDRPDQGGWVQVRLANGNLGWMQSAGLARI